MDNLIIIDGGMGRELQDASVIGGCCGIGPVHFQALAKWKAEQVSR
jgi:S-methylmethionine-dependent homocysteine/selenocysteine methylase